MIKGIKRCLGLLVTFLLHEAMKYYAIALCENHERWKWRFSPSFVARLPTAHLAFQQEVIMICQANGLRRTSSTKKSHQERSEAVHLGVHRQQSVPAHISDETGEEWNGELPSKS